MTNKEKLRIAVQALEDIVDPIARIQKNMGPGYILDGMMAIRVAEDRFFIKDIAKTALKEIGGGD